MSATPSKSDKVTLKIPRPLYNRLKQLIADTGFNSVTEFSVYVLRDLASPIERTSPPKDELTAAELEAVRKRLNKLGYL